MNHVVSLIGLMISGLHFASMLNLFKNPSVLVLSSLRMPMIKHQVHHQMPIQYTTQTERIASVLMMIKDINKLSRITTFEIVVMILGLNMKLVWTMPSLHTPLLLQVHHQLLMQSSQFGIRGILIMYISYVEMMGSSQETLPISLLKWKIAVWLSIWILMFAWLIV